MMQLGWVADCFTLDGKGDTLPLKGTLLEEMHKRGTE
jgi:hypothetical protein